VDGPRVPRLQIRPGNWPSVYDGSSSLDRPAPLRSVRPGEGRHYSRQDQRRSWTSARSSLPIAGSVAGIYLLKAKSSYDFINDPERQDSVSSPSTFVSQPCR
jgi:hypothetical protein